MLKNNGRKILPLLSTVMIAGFTGYMALDTFVIPHSYVVVAEETSAATEGTVGAADENTRKHRPGEKPDAEMTGKNRPGENSDSGSSFGKKKRSSDSGSDGSTQSRKKKKSSDGSDSDGDKSTSGTTGQSRGTDTEAGTADTQTGATDSATGAADTQTGTDTASGTSSGLVSTLTQDTYQDSNVTITMKEYRVGDTTVHVADVSSASGGVLKTSFAQSTYGRNVSEKTSDMAADVNAILAINGDNYGSREKGYVIRNGVLYRDTAASGQEDLVIYEDGSFQIISEDEVTAQELLDAGALQVFSFGPALITEGEISVSAGEEVGKAKASNPRTALGLTADGHYLFVVSDGRTSESEGLSLSELADFMKKLGAVTAYNLDGGGSSTMVFNGTVVNTPTTNGNKISERKVTDIVYIGC